MCQPNVPSPSLSGRERGLSSHLHSRSLGYAGAFSHAETACLVCTQTTTGLLEQLTGSAKLTRAHVQAAEDEPAEPEADEQQQAPSKRVTRSSAAQGPGQVAAQLCEGSKSTTTWQVIWAHLWLLLLCHATHTVFKPAPQLRQHASHIISY